MFFAPRRHGGLRAQIRYRPGRSTTRGQMGVFITVTFGLTLYGV